MTDNAPQLIDQSDPVVEPEQPDQADGGHGAIEIRRRPWLSAAVAAAAGVVALAYLTRVISGAATGLDVIVLVVLVLITGAYAALLADSRAPLLIADDQGLRVRRGALWRGVGWSNIERVEHHPRRGLLRDGVLRFNTPADATQVETSLRLSWGTRIHGVDPDALTEAISSLSGPDTEVLELRELDPDPGRLEVEDELEDFEDFWGREDREGSTPWSRLSASLTARDGTPGTSAAEASPAPASEPITHPAPQEVAQAAAEPTPEPTPEPVRASTTPVPLRTLMSGVRAEITRHRTAARTTADASSEGATALHLSVDDTAVRLPEEDQLRRVEPDLTDLVPVTPRAPAPPEPVVIEDRPDPVIGPVLAQARDRIGLSVDQVAERTRIRPHVIEAIEVDDFAPCGGDFYARGHLRTLARVLGVDANPLLTQYADLYAHAPIDARRVFEADLATGPGGTLRGTRGGPNWSVLIAAVMTVVLIWSVARLITDNPAAIEPDAPQLNPSGGLNGGASEAPEVPVVLTASGGGARVIVRNGSEVVFNGPIAFGQSTTLEVSPPVRISTTDGSLRVSVDGADRGAMGETGQEAQATYVVR